MYIWIGVSVMAVVALGFCWFIGEVSVTTKLAFTLAYVASWPLLLIPNYDWLFYLAQCVFVAVFGVATFGLDWLIGRR